MRVFAAPNPLLQFAKDLGSRAWMAYTKKPDHKVWAFRGGLTYISMKHHLDDKFREDLISLYAKLVDLGMEYRNGKVYLADLEEKDV